MKTRKFKYTRDDAFLYYFVYEYDHVLAVVREDLLDTYKKYRGTKYAVNYVKLIDKKELTEVFDYDDLPEEIKAVCNTFDDDGDSYKECRSLEQKLLPLGYTFDWYLDGVPYNFSKTA